MRKLLLWYLITLSVSVRAQTTAHDNLLENLGGASSGISGTEDVYNNPYTGNLGINTSFFSYSNPNSGLSHSLNAVFDGSGIRMSDLATDMGMKWSLYTGASLRREVHGLPDEGPGGYLTLPIVTGFNSNDTSDGNPYVNDQRDGEIDIYYYEIGGVSGKFLIGKGGKLTDLTPGNNIQITALNAIPRTPSSRMDSCTSKRFELLDSKGVKYLFEVYNCEQLKYQDRNRYATTEWFLTSIIDPFYTDSIVLDYSQRYTSYAKFRTATSYNLDQSSQMYPYPNGRYLCSNLFENTLAAKTMRLNSIRYINGDTIKIGYDSFYRLDVPSNSAIRTIRKFNNGKGLAYLFDYSYAFRYRAYDTASFYPGIVVNDLDYKDYTNEQGYSPGTLHTESYNLQLNRIRQFNGGDTLLFYGFEYEPMSLPERFSQYAIDMFGYYNGKHNEGPILKIPLGNTMLFYGYDRFSDLQYTRARSLKTLLLPAGGKIRFEYDAHSTRSMATDNTKQVSLMSDFGLRVKRIIYSDGINAKNDIKKEYRYVETDGSTTSGIMVNSPNHSFDYNEYYGSQWSDLNTYILKLCNGGLPDLGVMGDFYSRWISRTTEPLNYLVRTKGSLIGYGRVEEYLGSPAFFKSKKVTTYTTAEDYPVPVNQLYNLSPFPYIPDLDFAWGLPKVTESYNQAGLMLSRKAFSYDVQFSTMTSDSLKSLKVARNAQGPLPAFNPQPRYAIFYGHPIQGKTFLHSSTETTYFKNGLDKSVTQDFQYNQTYNTLERVGTTNGEGETIEYKYFYPYHFGRTPFNEYFHSDLKTVPLRIEKWVWHGVGDIELIDVTSSKLEIITNGFAPKKLGEYVFAPAVKITPAIWGAHDSLDELQKPAQFVKKATYNYAANGNLIEMQNASSVASTLYGYQGFYPIANIVNARVDQVAYSSFETEEGNGWENVLSPRPQPINGGITGEKCYDLILNVCFQKTGLDANRKYTISYWSNGTAARITKSNNTTVGSELLATHKGWNLYRAEVSGTTSVGVGKPSGSNIQIDELRLHPSDAMMETRCYNPLTGVTSTSDQNNRIQTYEYDVLGRLKYIRDQDNNILQANDYKIQEPQF